MTDIYLFIFKILRHLRELSPVWTFTGCYFVFIPFLSLCISSQSEQKAKKGEDLDADDEKVGEEDSRFMKLAKKLTAKTLQRKGLSARRIHERK